MVVYNHGDYNLLLLEAPLLIYPAKCQHGFLHEILPKKEYKSNK